MKIIIPRQEIEVSQGEEFQLRGSIGTNKIKFLLLHALAQPELFIICQEQFKDNKKHWIENSMTFHRLGEKYNFSWEEVPKPISLTEVNKYQTGNTILWNEGEQKFIIGEKARDIYFPEESEEPAEPYPNAMKAVWANRINLKGIKEAGFDTMISFNFYTRTISQQKETLENAIGCGIKIVPVLHGLLKEHNIAGIEALINRWKDNQGIGGWLLYDEPGLHRISISTQIEDYNVVKGLDSAHTIYMTYIASGNKDYYTTEASDQIIVTCYPVLKEQEADYKEILKRNLQTWIDSTNNKDIIANIQAFHTENIEHKPWANPIGTIQNQYNIWKNLSLNRKGYTLYAWIGGSGSGSRGIAEIPDLLGEVTEFNGR